MADRGQRASSQRGDRVLIGEFGRAHGVRGEVRLKSYTAEPSAIAGYEPLEREDGASVILSNIRPVSNAPDMFIARVEGITTREQAEALSRMGIYVPRERLETTLEDDEFLQADLIGARVEDESGALVGRLVAFYDFGAGDLIEIKPQQGGSPFMMPFTKAFVPVVDAAARRIVIIPPADDEAEESVADGEAGRG